jgi:peptide/nickel transport system substrate-binding protein
MIIPRHVFEPYNGPNAAEAPANFIAVGTGPYYVKDFKEEDILIIGDDIVSTIKITYVPNSHFREPDKPYFSKVELQGGGGDAIIAARAVQKGLVDFAWNLQVDDQTLAQFEAGGKGQVIDLLGAWVERIMINFTDPNKETESGERSSTQYPHLFLADRKVRKAITYSIDRQAIAKLYGRGGRATANLLVSPTIYQSPNTRAEFNLERAAELLESAGWSDTDGDGIRDKDGRKLSIVFQTSINPVRQQTQEIVRKALRSIGFEVELKNIDSSIFFGPVGENTNTRRHFYANLEEFAYSNKSPDPGAYMKGWTCSEIARQVNNWATANWARYCNPAYDSLYQQSTTELNPAKRRLLIVQMNDILIEDVAVIPLVHLVDFSGVSRSLKGVDLNPWDVEVWNIKDWRY